MTVNTAHVASLKKKEAFLAAYRENGNITLSAEQIGIARRTHYDWLASDPDYAAAFADAENHAIDRLEQEARRRAVEGTEKPVYQGGKRVGAVREYSDTLLIFLLKGARPEKYRERISTELTGKGGGPLQIADVTAIPDDELAKMALALAGGDDDEEAGGTDD